MLSSDRAVQSVVHHSERIPQASSTSSWDVVNRIGTGSMRSPSKCGVNTKKIGGHADALGISQCVDADSFEEPRVHKESAAATLVPTKSSAHESRGVDSRIPVLGDKLAGFTLEDAAGDLGSVWCPTAFEIAHRMAVDPTIAFQEGSIMNGPFVAFGDVLCIERYIVWETCICNHICRRAPVDSSILGHSPHMTLAKLEIGCAKMCANQTTWLVDTMSGPEEHDLSSMLREVNETLRHDSTIYRLHSCRLSRNYDISSGKALDAYRRVQSTLRSRLAHLGECVSF